MSGRALRRDVQFVFECAQYERNPQVVSTVRLFPAMHPLATQMVGVLTHVEGSALGSVGIHQTWLVPGQSGTKASNLETWKNLWVEDAKPSPEVVPLDPGWAPLLGESADCSFPSDTGAVLFRRVSRWSALTQDITKRDADIQKVKVRPLT